MNTREMEIELARFFDSRANIIIPNVHWGLGLAYEADLVIVNPSRYVTEIEIKVSKGDIKADLSKKYYAHKSRKIKKFFYAVPENLIDCEYLPLDCGLIVVSEQGKKSRARINKRSNRCRIIRPPRVNSRAEKLTDKEYSHLLHLGCMRIWNLKEKLLNIQAKK